MVLTAACLGALAAGAWAQAPANDLCENAIGPLTVGSITPGSTIGATQDASAPSPCGDSSSSGYGVWYTVDGTGNTMTASVCAAFGGGGGDYDTQLTVYCLGCETPTCITGADDTPGCGLQTAVSWCSQAGRTYNILVHGFSSGTGNFQLAILDDGVACTGAVDCAPKGACCTCLAAPYNCDVTSEATCAAWGQQWQGADVPCFRVLADHTFSASPAAPISNTLPPTVSTIAVPTGFGTIYDVNIRLDIDHTFTGDITIEVAHGSQSLVLWGARCGATDNIHATADDEGRETLCDVVAAGPSNAVFFAPAVAGNGELALFDGMNAEGDWTLTITDGSGGDDGVLQSWAVIFVGANDIEATCKASQPGTDEDEDADMTGRASRHHENAQARTGVPTHRTPVRTEARPVVPRRSKEGAPLTLYSVTGAK